MEDKPKRQRHAKEVRIGLFVQLFIGYYMRLQKGSITSRDLFRGNTSEKGNYVSLATEYHLGCEVSFETVLGTGLLKIDETKPYENNSPYVFWNGEFPTREDALRYIKFSKSLREEKAMAKQIAEEEEARLAKEEVKTNFPSSVEVEGQETTAKSLVEAEKAIMTNVVEKTNEIEEVDEVKAEYDFAKMTHVEFRVFLGESELRRRKLDAQRARNDYERNLFIEKLIKGE